MIRQASLDDVAAIARVHVDSWRTTYRGLLPDEHLAGLTYERRERLWREAIGTPRAGSFVLVATATDSGEIEKPGETAPVAGFVSAGPELSGRPSYRGEVYAIYLRDDYHGRGIGRQLMNAAAKRLAEAGLDSLLVWVLQDNPSRHFYAALGGVEVTTKLVIQGEVMFDEVAYGWPDARLLYGTKGTR